jgi:ATP-dependent RNA helicase DeaD
MTETADQTQPAVPSFAELGLPDHLVKALAARGITSPTPVQASVIPLALQGGDLLAQARTGSGKTMAFLLPLAARIAAGEISRAWIVCPTRELAQQASREAETIIGAGKTAVLVGGVPPYPQVKDLRRGVPLVIGTPGRMCDHLAQGNLKPDAEIVILDEADQMMDMGFSEDMDRLVKDLGESVARWLFSATFPRHLQMAVDRWLDKPREVRLDTRAGSSHVPQKFVVTKRGEEVPALARLLHILEPTRALVFVRTREDVERIVRAVSAEGLEAAGISGELAQDARERVLERFRAGKLTVLVGTDVAARGIDVPGVTHVFNFGLPMSAEAYTHRVGRTARAGADGEAWTLIGQYDRPKFSRMAFAAKCKPEEVPLPTAGKIVEAKRERLAKRVQDSLGEKLALPASFKALVGEFSAEAVLAALVHRLIPDAAIEKNVAPAARPAAARSYERSEGPGPARGERTSSGGEAVSLFMGIGLEDGVSAGTLVALLCHQRGLVGDDIGKIRLFDRHSIIGVRPEIAEKILDHPLHHRGRPVPVRPDRMGESGTRNDDRRGPPPRRPYTPRRDG